MRFKKFLLIPLAFLLLVFLYSAVINSLSTNATLVKGDYSVSKTERGEVIGVGQAVSVQVSRAKHPYMFGLVSLPAYIDGIGNISTLNTVFFGFSGAIAILLTTVFVIIERRSTNMSKFQGGRAFLDKSSIWKRIGKAAGVGAVFAFVSYIISGDASSMALGLLVAYLEFRLFE